ncbi:MAG: tRNA (guanosine(37)-N1)-methyltransferase TrmD [Polyangiaceae bacterium]|nr:tRNA (guanosine(37)-N1)-methyltransferase TrmD [Polyangiaceae bacterium]
MKVGVVTLFPELFDAFAKTSFIGRAIEQGTLELVFENLREHGLGNHRSVDDTPYGGGFGMVLRADVVVSAVEALEARMGARLHRVLLTPNGRRFDQALAREMSLEAGVLFICGRYEGFDERVSHFVDSEVSLGDFVVNGGEVVAMTMLEAVVRLLPGVLGHAESTAEESFSDACAGLLEYPQYTRPLEFRGLEVPEVLRKGDHEKIRRWRTEQSEARTMLRRPDLVGGANQNKKGQKS